MILPYLSFANVVARAEREVRREAEYCDIRRVPIIAYSPAASVVDSETGTVWLPYWAQFVSPNGPVIVWQAAWETGAEGVDRTTYYRQIKEVIRHELRHVRDGLDHPDDPAGTVYAQVRLA